MDEYPVDYSSPVGRVRKYIPDVEQLPDPADPDGLISYIFSDEEIQSFIDDETSDGIFDVTSWRIRRAAAWAMVAIANSENLILKKIITQDQQTDGPMVAKQLIAAAALLFDQAKAEENAISAAASTENMFAIFPGSDRQHQYVVWPLL